MNKTYELFQQNLTTLFNLESTMRWIICKRVDYNTKLRIMHQAFGRVYKILENRDKKARKLLHIQQKIESPYDD